VSGADGRRLAAPTPVPTSAIDVWIAIEQAVPSVTTRPEALDEYTPAIRQVYAMSRLSAEVNNGGFSQFFFNGGGVWLDDAIGGFAAPGLDGYRRLTIEAADAVVAQMNTLVAAQRGKALEAYAAWTENSDLERFDDRWWELPDLDEALDRFVADHAGEIWAGSS
jgi:hypothetical protein